MDPACAPASTRAPSARAPSPLPRRVAAAAAPVCSRSWPPAANSRQARHRTGCRLGPAPADSRQDKLCKCSAPAPGPASVYLSSLAWPRLVLSRLMQGRPNLVHLVHSRGRAFYSLAWPRPPLTRVAAPFTHSRGRALHSLAWPRLSLAWPRLASSRLAPHPAGPPPGPLAGPVQLRVRPESRRVLKGRDRVSFAAGAPWRVALPSPLRPPPSRCRHN